MIIVARPVVICVIYPPIVLTLGMRYTYLADLSYLCYSCIIILSTCSCSIETLKFYFKLLRNFSEDVIETQNAVDATIDITITLMPNRIGGMSVRIEVCSMLDRKFKSGDSSFDQFWKRGGVLDVIVLVLLIFSSLTHINSILNTVKLYKVHKYKYYTILLLLCICMQWNLSFKGLPQFRKPLNQRQRILIQKGQSQYIVTFQKRKPLYYKQKKCCSNVSVVERFHWPTYIFNKQKVLLIFNHTATRVY